MMEVREKVSNEDLQAYLKTLVEKSKVAQKQFERDYTKQRPIDEVVRAIGKAVCDNGKTLGEEAFAETGMGNVESKIAKLTNVALLHHCGDSLSGIGGEKRPGIVHRIDRDTSGLIIAAKNDAAHLALSAQLKDHSLSRTYECLVTGNMKQDSGTVDAPIGRSSADRKKMAVVPTGRRAVTHWEVVARYPGVTHLRCRLETGRTHQIRVHMAYIGHPILGDTVYGAKKPVPGLTGQCLHATGLRFIHPRTGEPVELHCPLPPEFTAMLQKLQSKAQ